MQASNMARSEPTNHLLLLFSAHLILARWMQRPGVSGHGRFDVPSDLNQILRALPSSSKARAASTYVLASGLIALGEG
jgi:hypothetical protein